MDIDFLRNEVKKSKETGVAVLFRNLLPEIPSWEDFANAVNTKSNENRTKPDDPRYGIIGKLKLWSATVIEISDIESCVDLSKPIELLKSIHPFRLHEANGMFALSTVGHYGYHEDKTDNFFWQCSGSVEWDVSGSKYILNPGDVIFNPVGIPHQVTTLSARNAVIFSFAPDENFK